MWFTLAKVWLSLWITMIGLIEAGNEPTSNTVSKPQKKCHFIVCAH